MLTQLDLYKIWAPDQALWTQWAKPVVFMNISAVKLLEPSDLEERKVNWITYEPGTMLIVDLKGKQGIEEGLGLAGLGYRPIPLYNGVPGPSMVTAAVQTDEIVSGLCGGAHRLEELSLSKTANPAFLLDSDRMRGAKKKPGTFDNRWCVVRQDMPSANYLKSHRIRRIVVRTDRLQEDLKYLLYDYQKKGIEIAICGENGNIKDRKVQKPKQFHIFFYRFLMLLGLARCATGGFGMVIPEFSSESDGHYRTHRAG